MYSCTCKMKGVKDVHEDRERAINQYVDYSQSTFNTSKINNGELQYGRCPSVDRYRPKSVYIEN